MSLSASEHIAFLRRLRTVRDFLPDPIPDSALEDILEVGRWSGSASNRQPVEIVVVRDSAARQMLMQGGSNTAGNAAVSLVVVTPGDAARADLEAYDDGRLSERILLAAAAHGIGSGVTTLKNEGPANAKTYLGIPADRRVRTVINLGYPNREAIASKPKVPQPRKPLADFAHWDHY